MIVIQNYPLAVIFCILAMICWGSWQNTRNWAGLAWRFELYYWDCALGILLLSFLAAITIGSMGDTGQTFWESLAQATPTYIAYAMLGGVIWNLGNLLLVAGISLAGMATAFPIGGGLAWLLGILVNYIGKPEGNPYYLLAGGTAIALAIYLCTLAYQRLQQGKAEVSYKGVILAFIAGVLIAFFYRFVAISLISDYANPEIGKLTPLTGVFFFCVGAYLSTWILNPIFMKKPVKGEPVNMRDYLKGTPKQHLIGILGGMIWCCGMVFSFMAADQAGFAISYGLSNSAPIVAALWGIFVWKEFANAPAGTSKLLAGMFGFYFIGLVLLILAK
ncbi:MAG: GRP family sugar transporter [Thermoflexibacter sp.]